LWYATQPIEEPEYPQHLRTVFDWIGWDRIVYSSDYPHWDYDDPRLAIKIAMSETERSAIFRRNAEQIYRFKSFAPPPSAPSGGVRCMRKRQFTMEVLPFGDPHPMMVYGQFERDAYDLPKPA